jgi:hypothetical protein
MYLYVYTFIHVFMYIYMYLYSGNFLLPKLVDYVEQGDTHAATLTVKETIEFAWKSTTGGHHSYGVAMNEESAAFVNEDDADLIKVFLFCL